MLESPHDLTYVDKAGLSTVNSLTVLSINSIPKHTFHVIYKLFPLTVTQCNRYLVTVEQIELHNEMLHNVYSSISG